jgi:bifunctional N-acetylglucosamine-1-phosphate-uridyltransferase/glucosamine-1-phosphate-acetyltransferase GlmU-like protein
MVLTGKMISDALHDSVTKWEDLRVHVQESHIRTAQALNVKLGLIEKNKREYILSTDTGAYEASDIAELITLIDLHGMECDTFQIATIVNGKETGHGRYEIDEYGEFEIVSCVYLDQTIQEEYGGAVGIHDAVELYKEEHQVQA